MDIADSVCPIRMTRLSLRQVRQCFDERITVMGGIPSVALLPKSMPDLEFDRFLDTFFGLVQFGPFWGNRYGSRSLPVKGVDGSG